jgi:hypothetical protein
MKNILKNFISASILSFSIGCFRGSNPDTVPIKAYTFYSTSSSCFSSFEYFHEYLISSAYMLTDYCINGSTSIPGTDVGLSRAYIILLSNIFYVLTAGSYSERQHKSNET